MTSKERVRAAMEHKPVDRVPAAYEAVNNVTRKLMKHYGYTDYNQLMNHFKIDIIPASPTYIGPALKKYTNPKGETVKESFWGFETTYHTTAIDTYGTTSYFPLNNVHTVKEVDDYRFPDPDWFDYSAVTRQCDRYPDKAIIIGHEGPFQIVTYLIEMDKFFMLMIDEPEVAQRILDRISDFEMEYYKRMFEAGKGHIDILRTHDDYGTQISLLFSVAMWKTFFKKNTEKLVNLAHSYHAFFQQHSCGSIRPLIPELINCNVDAIEPLQKVPGLEPIELYENFGGQITFHGGIDTQRVLPFGTAKEVKEETEYYIRTLNHNGGYILMASQAFEGDVPIENIEAIYAADRSLT